MVIDLAAKYPLSEKGQYFFDRARDAITKAGFELRFIYFPTD